MKRVLEHIERNMADYAESAFLRFLCDDSVEARRRLAFLPRVTHFVMTFGDLCAFLLPVEPPADRFQELVNANAREDRGHWRWFLSDLAVLEQDRSVPLSEAISLIWDESNVRTRMLSYHLCAMAVGASSIEKLVLIHCIEGAFKMTVGALAAAAEAFSAETGKHLAYIGRRHSDSETSHTLEDPAVRRALLETALPSADVERLRRMVARSFSLFRAFADEMLSLATSAEGTK
jgi:hypothetical protein